MWSLARKALALPSAAEALPGRAAKMPVRDEHFANGHPIAPPFPVGCSGG